MEIRRIDTYIDSRFPEDVLLAHGAFLADGEPCAFRITGRDSAVVFFHDYGAVLPVIEEFRFYAGHICEFFDDQGRKLAEYPSEKLRETRLSEIQPSQFYVDEEKLRAVSSFLTSWDQTVIPVARDQETGGLVSLDGHTRMYWAHLRGWDRVLTFETETEDFTFDFAREARRRGIVQPGDITVLEHGEYEEKWNQYCDAFFAARD